jgi:hypothetical protein
MKYSGPMEQLVSSGGNFLLFVIVAKMFSLESFADFALKWGVVQLLLGIAIQWVFLPITSFQGNIEEILLNATRKYTKLLCAGVVVIPLYLMFVIDSFSTQDFFICYALFVVVILNDMYRYLKIRELLKSKVLLFTSTRWGLILLSVIVGSFFHNDDGKMVLIFILCPNLIIALFSFNEIIFRIKKLKTNCDLHPKSNDDRELLTLSGANYINTLATTFVFARVDPIAFGALQAFRSVSNFLPIVIQYLETHVSSDFASTNKTSFISMKNAILVLVTSLFLLALIGYFQTFIITTLYAESFINYSHILIFTVAISILQSINRMISIEFRLQSRLKIFYVMSFIVMVSACCLIASGFLNVNVTFIMVILLLTPICQLLINFVFKQNWTSK